MTPNPNPTAEERVRDLRTKPTSVARQDPYVQVALDAWTNGDAEGCDSEDVHYMAQAVAAVLELWNRRTPDGEVVAYGVRMLDKDGEWFWESFSDEYPEWADGWDRTRVVPLTRAEGGE